MTAPHRVSPVATIIDLILVAALLGTLTWLAVAVVQQLRRPRRQPKPRTSWLRDFRAEAEQRRNEDAA